MKKGHILELEIESMAYGGKGIARLDGRVVFVQNAVQGDVAEVRIIRIKSNYAEGRVLSLKKPSPYRQDAPCRFFGTCGGCKWQDVGYAQQLEFKRNIVRDALRSIGKIQDVDVRPAIGSPEEFFYRNKMEYTFSDSRWLMPEEIATEKVFNKDFALGLHVPGRYDRILDLDRCLLQSEMSNRVLEATREFALDNGIRPYSVKTHSGLLRFLVIRESKNSKGLLVILITSEVFPQVRPYADFLVGKVPEITGIVHGVNPSKSQVAVSETYDPVYGDPVILEKLGAFRFEISPRSFFQTNTKGAECLYETIVDLAGFRGDETVFDLYCGTGSISVFISKLVGNVIGFESIPAAILDANRNARLNNVTNCRFVEGDLKLTLADEETQPDVMIIDPPRAGMHADVVKTVLKSQPREIVYVSCNPTTQARDIALLSESYDLHVMQPVDMFPHTYHIENVARLTAK